MGPTFLALGLSLLAAESSFDLASGAETTVSGGAVALVADEAPSPMVEFSLTTMSGMRLMSERTSFILKYHPRTYYQRPNIADANRPLFLHQLDVSYTSALTRRTNLGWTGNVLVGDVTYANLVRTFDEGTAAAAAARLPLLFFSTEGSLSYATSSRNVVSVGPTASYRTVLNTLPSDVDAQIPTSLNLGITVSDFYTVTPRNDLALTFAATYSQTEEPQQQAAALDTMFGTALASFGHRHSLTSKTTFSGGAGATREVESGSTSVFPLATVSQDNSFRWLGDSFSSSVATGVRGFLDPVLAILRPQSFVTMNLTGQHTRALSSAISLSGWTSLTKKAVDPAQYETSGSVDLAAVYQLSPGLSFRAGVNWLVRAPHLSEPDGLAVQSQPLGFISIRGTLGTDRNQGSWL